MLKKTVIGVLLIVRLRRIFFFIFVIMNVNIIEWDLKSEHNKN